MENIKEEVLDMKKEVEKVQEEEKSYFWQIITELKKGNKRMFIIWIITFIALMISIIYNMYIISDIGVVEDSYQTIENVDTIEGSSINNGGK